ncbi:MAG: VWA domain-containing protein, partial [Planctomycetes bacterium]|nr:VWA domain-containing protein [Planctomycetota bacterium]
MEEILRWLAAWRGIEPEPGTELQFEFSSFPTGGLGMLVLMGAAAALFAVGYLYRRDGQNLTLPQRLLLGSLRALAVLAALALLLEPNLVTVKRQTRPGQTILLVDGSQSMTQIDAWRREAVLPIAAGWREVGAADPSQTTRIDLVKALLAHGDGALVQKLAAKNQAQLYAFAGGIEQLPLLPPAPRRGPDGAPLPPDPNELQAPPRLDLAQLRADGRVTNLGASLRAALDRSRTAEIAAVVIVGDGRRNAGPQGAEVARLLNQRKIPHVFVLGAGDPSETQAVAMARFDAPEKVLQKDPFEMKCTLSAQGYDALQVTVRLVRADDKGQEQVVRTQQVLLGGDKPEVQVEWKDLSADAPGRFLFRAEVQPPDGEALVPERHSKTNAVEVLGERARVLLLAGTPNREYQILRNLLVRDKTIDVSCWLQSAAPKFPQDGDEGVRLENLPEQRQQFDPYDVVVLIDPNPGKLTSTFCQHLQQHVLEGGCGLWWVGGEKYSLEAMRQGAVTAGLAGLLPIVPDLDYAERKIIGGIAFPRPWAYALSAEGEDGIGAK